MLRRRGGPVLGLRREGARRQQARQQAPARPALHLRFPDAQVRYLSGAYVRLRRVGSSFSSVCSFAPIPRVRFLPSGPPSRASRLLSGGAGLVGDESVLFLFFIFVFRFVGESLVMSDFLCSCVSLCWRLPGLCTLRVLEGQVTKHLKLCCPVFSFSFFFPMTSSRKIFLASGSIDYRLFRI